MLFAMYRSLDLYKANYDPNAVGRAKPSYFEVCKGYEKLIQAQEVIPQEAKEIIVSGKDFSMKVRWDQFSAYDPNSDFSSMDPCYSVYKSKTTASARKVYKLALKDKDFLSSITYNELNKWLTSNRIAYQLNMSVWH